MVAPDLSVRMLIRFLLLLLLLEYSLCAVPAQAAKRPGAARPLRLETLLLSGAVATEQGGWMFGIAPIAGGEELWFRHEGGTLHGVQRVTRRLSGDGKVVWVPQGRGSHNIATDYPQIMSPDGRRVAFSSTRSGMQAIYIRSTRERDADARRIATLARNPVWLDASTLLFESTRPGRSGLYKLNIAGSAKGAPELWFEKGGEAAVSPDGQTVCVAAHDDRLRTTQLYLIAADGSGARALPQTVGARRPGYSPKGDAIYFDAPLPREESAPSPSNARVIWMMPLVSTPPAAQLSEVRVGKTGAVEIWGTAFSEAGSALEMQLEIGRATDEDGDDVRQWKKLETRPAPIHGGVLALWQPAASDKATMHLRLTVIDADGDRAESTLLFNWPLQIPATTTAALPPLFATQPELYGLGTKPEPATALPETALPETVPRETVLRETQIRKPRLPDAPSPALPPAAPQVEKRKAPLPAIAALPAPAPTIRVTTNATAKARPTRTAASANAPQAGTGLQSTPVAKVSSAVKSTPLAAEPKPKAKPPAKTPVRLAQAPVSKQSVRETEKSKPRIAQAQAAPKKSSGGIPSQMKAGSSVPVTVVLRNTGSRSWSSQGPSPVRLIYRWVDAKTDIRHRWAVKWLRETVQPGESTQMKFDLAAPSRAGDFILTYALVRLNSQNYDGKKYLPPPTRTSNHAWPGEFGAVSFRIKVNS